MTLLEGYINDSIYIDFGAEITYGSDQVYNSFPKRFATVLFQLFDTYHLSFVADRIRCEKGYKPMHPNPLNKHDDYDENGWYDFYISLNDYNHPNIDSYIEFVVVSEDAPDNEEVYRIDLSEQEQQIIYERLNEQCKNYLDKSCGDLLAEAEKEIENG